MEYKTAAGILQYVRVAEPLVPEASALQVQAKIKN